MAYTKGWRDTIFPGSTPYSTIEEAISAPGQDNVLENYASDHSPGAKHSRLVGLQVSGKRPLTDKAASDDTNQASGFKRKRREHHIHIPSRTTYHEFMDLDQAGSAKMAYDKANIVAIKRLGGIDASSTQLGRPFVSDTVVSIIDMYHDGDHLKVIYESMDISLRKVTSILNGPLKHFQIAAICKEVGVDEIPIISFLFTQIQLVAGLSYIHDNLSLYHGDLSCGTIMLKDGSIKIGKSRPALGNRS